MSRYDIPNDFDLLAADFDHDVGSYRAALAFLGDVCCGVPEAKALGDNGGTPGLLVAWEGIQKFRRALGKARLAGEAERQHAARKREEADPYRTPPRRGFWDPFRRGARAPDASPGFLGAFRRSAQAANAQDGPPPPGGQRFTAYEDLTDAQVAEANGQQRQMREPLPAPSDVWAPFANRASQSFPWPTDSSGQPLPLQRGEVSEIPGVGRVKPETGGK